MDETRFEQDEHSLQAGLVRGALEAANHVVRTLEDLRDRAPSEKAAADHVLSARAVDFLLPLAEQSTDLRLALGLLSELEEAGVSLPEGIVEGLTARVIDDPRISGGGWPVGELQGLWEQFDGPVELATPLALAAHQDGALLPGEQDWREAVDWSVVPSTVRREVVLRAASAAARESWEGTEEEGHRALRQALVAVVPEEFPEPTDRWLWVLTGLLVQDVVGGWTPTDVLAETLAGWAWPETPGGRGEVLAATKNETFENMSLGDEWLSEHLETLRGLVAADQRASRVAKAERTV